MHSAALPSAYVPALQVVIAAEDAVSGQAIPGGQGVHVAAPPSEYDPALQAMGKAVVLLQALPAGQRVQLVALASL